MTRRILDGFLQADHVIAVSAATRDELLKHRLFLPEQISVVRNGAHPMCSPLPDPAADAIATQLIPAAPSDTIWLLNVGSTLPRKRLDLLLHVFAAIRREAPHVRLLRAGGGFTPSQLELAQELGVRDAIVILPFLEREVLSAIYRRAALLLLTADAEGFGLPLVEAMACGCPVVASDLPVLREVGGTAASYCGVGNIDSWREATLTLLADLARPDRAREVRQKLLAHAAGFAWAENARQTANVYKKLFSRG